METHKVIVTGTGRSGTTFLMCLLTQLGINTGYSKDDYHKYINPRCNGGLERVGHVDYYVIKNPEFCTAIPTLVQKYIIDHVFVLVRNMNDAASSRISHGRDPGGLWGTVDTKSQKDILLQKFGTLMSDLILNDVPHSCLIFPRLATDGEYCFKALKPLLEKIQPDLSLETFMTIFNVVSNPKLIHNYK